MTRTEPGYITEKQALLILPFVDRNPNRYWRKRPVAMAMAAALVMVLVVIALTVLMAVTPAQQHLGM